MVMKPNAVVELVNDVLLPKYQAERQRLDEVDSWYRWSPDKVKVSNSADRELKDLADISEAPWLGLIVTTLAQQLHAESVRSADRDTAKLWVPWQRNRMNAKQKPLYRAALAYGQSYTSAVPGDTGAVIRCHSPRDMIAVYQDPVEDEFPMYSLRVQGAHYRVLDEEAEYWLSLEDGRLTFIEPRVHDVGVTPVVRYTNQMDLEGRTPGEVEPFIPLGKRINKTSYDRLLTQHFNSWKIRTATGLDMPDDPEERARIKMLLRQQDILTGEEGVEFGTLDETSIDGFIKAHESDLETLAAVSQTPSHGITGKMVNLSAEALVEARSMLDLKAGERKVSFGDSDCQTLRLAAHIEGRREDAEDFSLSMQWADLESRSMAQAADALGKMATMLGIPVEMLWERIPNVDEETVKRWIKYKVENPSAEAQLANALNTQSNGVNG